jgi:hypothetical protein
MFGVSHRDTVPFMKEKHEFSERLRTAMKAQRLEISAAVLERIQFAVVRHASAQTDRVEVAQRRSHPNAR